MAFWTLPGIPNGQSNSVNSLTTGKQGHPTSANGEMQYTLLLSEHGAKIRGKKDEKGVFLLKNDENGWGGRG